MSVNEYLRRRKALVEEMDALEKKHGGNWTDEAREDFDYKREELERVSKLLDYQRLLDAETDHRQEPAFGEEGRGTPSWSRETVTPNLYAPDESVYEARKKTHPEAYEDEGLTFGAYLRATVKGPSNEQEERALSEGTDSQGGYTVPDWLAGKWIDALRARNPLVRAGAQTMILESDVNNIARLATDPTFSWAAENSTASVTDPTFGRVQLTPKTHRGIIRVSRELLQDGLNTEKMLERAFFGAMGTAMQSAVLVGASTSGGPTGLYESTAITGQSIAGSTAGTIAWTDLADGWQTLAEANVPTERLSCIMSPRTYRELSVLRAGSSNVWLNKPGLLNSLGMYATAAIEDNLSVGATTGCSWIAMGNFPSLILGYRLKPAIEVLKERFASNYQYGFLAAMRFDVGWEHDADFLRLTNIKATT